MNCFFFFFLQEFKVGECLGGSVVEHLPLAQGVSPIFGSPQGACSSLSLCLCLSLCVSHK